MCITKVKIRPHLSLGVLDTRCSRHPLADDVDS